MIAVRLLEARTLNPPTRRVNQKALTFDEVMERLAELDWKLEAAPWTAVYNAANNKMVTSKENVGLLVDLLYVHLAPPSAQAVKRARKAYRDIVHSTYPVAEDVLAARVDASRPVEEAGAIVVTDDISDDSGLPESVEAVS